MFCYSTIVSITLSNYEIIVVYIALKARCKRDFTRKTSLNNIHGMVCEKKGIRIREL
jgi:hypothetical protein